MEQWHTRKCSPLPADKATLIIELNVVYHLISCFLFFFLELVGFSIRIFLGRDIPWKRNLSCLVGAKKQLLFTTAFLPYNTAYKIRSAFCHPLLHSKQLTTPLFYSRQVFKICQMTIAYKLEV